MDSPFYGMIASLGFSWPPLNWALCNGALLSISQYSALYSLIGTHYGGDGRTSFGLPDLRGRVPVGWGLQPGLSNYPIGIKTGTEVRTLTQNNLPSHNHTATFTPTGGGGGGTPAEVAVSQTQGTKPVPDAGDFLGAAAAFGAPQPNYVPASSPGTVVELGGVSGGGGSGGGGTVTVHNTGAGTGFEIVQPTLAISWCICLQGLYPSRN